MEFIANLWLPIVLSAVFVFIISSVIHMFLGYHAADFSKVPHEEQALDTMRQLNLPPGNYALPKASGMKEFRTPEFQAKMKKGPVMFLNVRGGNTGMGKSLVLWFLYSIVISIFSAYLGAHAVGPDAHYLDVFRFVGCAAFMGYSLALFQDAIWMSRSWRATLTGAFDGLVYALITAGTFGWLW